MESNENPLVSVVTPVYNGGRYLDECIRSVLGQDYSNLEYLIVDNCSTDETLEIAKRYEAQDARIRVYSFGEFVDVIESHNRALRLISPRSKYCKIVSADDCIFPECLSRMVSAAESSANVGIVGAYALRGNEVQGRIVFDGLPYKTVVIPGPAACRSHFLRGPYFLGIPTSVLYRSDLIRRTNCFLPNRREHADISAFYECLVNSDFAFVHQVLAYEREHEAALSWKARQLYTSEGSQLLDLEKYGRCFLQEQEFNETLARTRREYYGKVASGVINGRGREFYRYHRAILEQSGDQYWKMRIVEAILQRISDLLFNPKQTLQKVVRRIRRTRLDVNYGEG